VKLKAVFFQKRAKNKIELKFSMVLDTLEVASLFNVIPESIFFKKVKQKI
jgi:hypothetical protein